MTFPIQIIVFFGLTILVGVLTWLGCPTADDTRNSDSTSDFYLAGKSLSWVFVAGSITLTNLSTDQLVGMNGGQMALLALWELAAVVGLFILTIVFVPIYYRENCTTTTELLERKYGDGGVRSLVAGLFLLINVVVYIPVVLYTGSLFIKSMFNLDWPVVMISAILCVIGGAYAILGGLRAVAISDTISGIGLLSMSLLVVFLSLKAVGFDLSDVPSDRLTLIGSSDSPIPWPTLLTGMLFIQIFYWSTNQTITQRAMACKTVGEAQRGVFVAAGIRLLIVPAIVVVSGICAFKLYGDIGDATYGRLVADILPDWMSGALAAVMVAGVLTTFNSVLNSTAAIYVVDFHTKYFNKTPRIKRLDFITSISVILISLCLVQLYLIAESIVDLVQMINGFFSMPILAAFMTGLLFHNVDGRAVIFSVLFGIVLYGTLTQVWTPFHYIHMNFITLWSAIGLALLINSVIFKKKARFVLQSQSIRISPNEKA